MHPFLSFLMGKQKEIDPCEADEIVSRLRVETEMAKSDYSRAVRRQGVAAQDVLNAASAALNEIERSNRGLVNATRRRR